MNESQIQQNASYKDLGHDIRITREIQTFEVYQRI